MIVITVNIASNKSQSKSKSCFACCVAQFSKISGRIVCIKFQQFSVPGVGVKTGTVDPLTGKFVEGQTYKEEISPYQTEQLKISRGQLGVALAEQVQPVELHDEFVPRAIHRHLLRCGQSGCQQQQWEQVDQADELHAVSVPAETPFRQ